MKGKQMNQRLSYFCLGGILSVIIPFSVVARNFDHSLERHWEPGKEKLRVISYNILVGFQNQTDKDRMNRMVQWVKGKVPDVLAMQELCGFSTEDLTNLGKEWGHPYAAIVRERSGYSMGITSKYPIEVKAKIVKGFCHGLLHVKIRGFDFLVTHLNPSSWKARREESQRIVEYAKSINSKKILLMGEMNSESPIDADYTEDHAPRLLTHYSKPNLVSGKWTDYSTIATFLSYPFYDLCYQFVEPENRGTFPTPILMSVSKNREHVAKRTERIDFIFGTEEMVPLVVDAFIMNDEENDYLSDHYPVGIDILYYPPKDK